MWQSTLTYHSMPPHPHPTHTRRIQVNAPPIAVNAVSSHSSPNIPLTPRFLGFPVNAGSSYSRALTPNTLYTHALKHPAPPTHMAQVNAGFFYSSAEQRERLVAAERAVVDEKVQRVIDLKKQVGARVQ